MELVTNSFEVPETVIGEEAHIVGRSSKAARGGEVVEGSPDGYDNLILLCAVHHKVVDDNPDVYPADRLRNIKATHEAWVAGRLRVTPPRPRGPHVLPRPPLRLVNREHELMRLATAVEITEEAPGPTVVVLSGMHGVGKSALTAHWAMLHWPRFGDGQLFADLSRRRRRGSVDLSAVLGDFLSQLGITERAIPSTFAERRDLYRRTTVGRKLLVILDDVDQSAQVMGLLPSGAGSLVVVTTNHALEELLFEGAVLVELDPLNRETSYRLLVELGGAERVEAEPLAVERLTVLCGGLPIALCVCAGRLQSGGRTRSVSSLVEGIEQAASPLRALSGPGAFAIDAVFDFAYNDLPSAAALTYRRLGLHPGPDLTAPVVACLTERDADEVARMLQLLQNAHLLESRDVGRWGLHDLVRIHARDCADRDDDRTVQTRVLTRVVDWYYGALRAADRAVVAHRLRLSDDIVVDAPNVPSFATGREAVDWFLVEATNVLAVVRLAKDMDLHARVWQMAEALWPFCYNLKHYSLWIESYEAGVRSASELADTAAEARMRSALARAYADQGDWDLALEEQREAVAAVARCENEQLKASVTEFGAILRFEQGDVADALAEFRRSRDMFDRCGNLRGVAIQDYQIGKCLIRLGAFERALDVLRKAQDSFVAIGDEVTLGRVLRREGEALRALGRLVEARKALETAEGTAVRLGLSYDEAQVCEVAAAVADDDDRSATAREWRERAYALYSGLGHPRADLLFDQLEATGTD